jgi:hypothetical protein
MTTEAPWQKKQREEQEREDRIRQWTHEGAGKDTEVWEDTVYWGFWRGVGGDTTPMPMAIFQTEEQAEAFAELFCPGNEDIHVGPVVLDIRARDNFEVPK